MSEITWKAPEFTPRQKESSWYWGSIIVAVLLIGIAVWQKNFLFGLFVVLGEMLFLLWGSKSPEEVEFHIHEKGIKVDGENILEWRECRSFAIADEPEGDIYGAFFYFDKRLHPTVRLQVPKNRLEEVRKNLALYLPQIEYEPTMADSLEEFLRF